MKFIRSIACVLSSSFFAIAAGAATPATVPTEMTVVSTNGKGGPEVLKVQRAPVPTPGAAQVLIQVRAAGVNPVDWKLREWGPRPGSPQDRVLGFDVAGVIVGFGKDVKDWKVGDEVIALTSPVGGGGYAEYAVANAVDIDRKPSNMDFNEAAGIPTVGVTVWNYLVNAVGPLKGKRVLIHGGAGGVGSAGVQIAKAYGATVIATASARNRDYLKSIGADEVIDYQKVKFEDVAKDIDIVFDTVGPDTTKRSLAVVKKGGVVTSVAAGLPAAECTKREIKCPGEVEDAGASTGLKAIRALAEQGKFKLNVDKTFPLEQAAQAQELNKEGRTRGKIILTVGK